MITHPLKGRFSSRNAGSVPFRAVLAAITAVAFTIPSVRASTAGQTILNQYLAPKNVNTATATNLAIAVRSAIDSGTTGLTPADLATSALQPFPVANSVPPAKVRGDRNTSAALVAQYAINALYTSSLHDPSFNADSAAITDGLVILGGTNTKENLASSGQIAVVKSALATVASLATTNAALLDADITIGKALASDAFLQSISKPANALTSILQGAMPGIYGLTGKNTTPQDGAENFVQGILESGTVPNGATYSSFAVSILKKVATNTSVAELVSYQVALSDTSTDLVNLADTLFAAYPPAVIKVTQGVTAVTSTSVNEAQRAAFISSLLGSAVQVKNAVNVVQGAVFLDPFYSGTFTQTVFNAIYAYDPVKGPKLLVTDATAIAKGVGATLGQAGDILTNVAAVFDTYIGNAKLPVTAVTSYATGLIGSASKSKVPASQFTGAAAGWGGGQLALTTGTTKAEKLVTPLETVRDLAGIVDLLADGIVTADTASATLATKAPAQIGSLVAAVAGFTKNNTFVTATNQTLDVAAFLAGTLADQIVTLNLGSSDQTLILAQIGKSLKSVVNATVDQAVTLAIGTPSTFPVIGAIAIPESPVTNL